MAASAAHVRIDDERLAAYARSLDPVAAAHDGSFFASPDAGLTTSLIVTFATVNFGSGFFPYVRKREGLSGSRTMAAHLRDEFVLRGPWTAPRLASLTPADCAEVFDQPAEGPTADLLGLFASALNDLGRLLQREYDGSAAALVEAAEGSAERLVLLLDRMPFFHDVERHPVLDIDVPFFKRAQLCAADLAGAFDGKGLGRFDDLDQLTLFADNLVPHVLRVDGVLVLDPALEQRIAAEDLLAPGSAEEVELRAVAVHAVERLAGLTGRPAHALDLLLWNRGQEPRYKAIPRPRCRCVFY